MVLAFVIDLLLSQQNFIHYANHHKRNEVTAYYKVLRHNKSHKVIQKCAKKWFASLNMLILSKNNDGILFFFHILCYKILEM